MNRNRIVVFLTMAALILATFMIIFMILFYSLMIIEMVNDGLMGPFIFIVFLVSLAFTIILLANRFLKGREKSPLE